MLWLNNGSLPLHNWSYHYDFIRIRSDDYDVYDHDRNTLQRRFMRCLKCHTKTDVIDSRSSDLCVRRRRQCPACKRKYSTKGLSDQNWFEFLTEALKKVLKVPTDD